MYGGARVYGGVLGKWRQEVQIHGELVASLSQTRSKVLEPVRWLSE